MSSRISWCHVYAWSSFQFPFFKFLLHVYMSTCLHVYTSPCLHVFLDASSHLYMKVCPSVRPSVPMSVRPLAFKRNRRKRRFQPARRILLPVQACSILFYFLSSLQFWIPRVQLMFCAENPEVFAKRVRYAFKARRKTESLLRYHLYIDCMPMDGLGELSETSFMKMLEWAKGTGRGRSIVGLERQVASRRSA